MTESTTAAFGLGLRLHFPLPGLPPRELPPSTAIVDIVEASRAQLLERFSAPVGEPLWQTVFEDGSAYAVQPGTAGDHLMRYRGAPAFHLSPDGRRLSCADPSTYDEEWRRTLLDTVLWSVALLHRAQLLHASAVDSPIGVVALVADQGSGKSSLAAQLAVDGWPLFTDDILAFERRGLGVTVHPGPALMNFPIRDEDPLSPVQLGEILARFPAADGEEAWIRVRTCSENERPLAAITLLRRGGSAPARVSRLAATPVDIRPHTLAFRDMPGAERRRFDAVSDLLERVPVLSLSAGSQVTVKELAETLRAELHTLPSR